MTPIEREYVFLWLTAFIIATSIVGVAWMWIRVAAWIAGLL